jgi:hypothetical protein
VYVDEGSFVNTYGTTMSANITTNTLTASGAVFASTS